MVVFGKSVVVVRVYDVTKDEFDVSIEKVEVSVEGIVFPCVEMAGNGVDELLMILLVLCSVKLSCEVVSCVGSVVVVVEVVVV